MILFKLVLTLLSLVIACPPMQAAQPSRIVAVGDFDYVNVGQSGYCGERSEVPSTEWKNILVRGDEQVWFRMKSVIHSTSFTTTCEGDYSFVPAAGKAYIIRFLLDARVCRFELFRVVPNSDPVREPLTRAEPQSCLFH